MKTNLCTIPIMGSAFGLCAWAAPPQSADVPTHITWEALPGAERRLDLVNPPPPVPVNGDVLWDQLGMARNCTYTAGNGNACSGVGVFGVLYGLQLCDDFILERECTILSLTVAYVTFLNAPPVNGANVTFYPFTQHCAPLDAAFAVDCNASAQVVPFSDCRFGLRGLYVTAKLSGGGITLPPGRWFVNVQPEDGTGNGDWYYQVRDTNNPPSGCDSYVRDSQPHDPCCTQGQPAYGFGNWTSAGVAGFGAGDAAFQIVGKCGGGGGDLTCHYIVKKSRSIGGCTTCPRVGDVYDSGVLCGPNGECGPSKLKSTVTCPSGHGSCILVLKNPFCSVGIAKKKCFYTIQYDNCAGDPPCSRSTRTTCYKDDCPEGGVKNCPEDTRACGSDDCGWMCTMLFDPDECRLAKADEDMPCKKVRCPK